jgi:hypothetical protein
MARAAASPVVRDGQPTGLRFDGRLTWVWWGQDEQGLDVVAAAGPRVLTFATRDACRTALAPAGSPLYEPLSAATVGPVLLLEPDHLRTPEGTDHLRTPGGTDHLRTPGGESAAPPPVPMGESVTDLAPAQEWAAGRRLVVPAESALDLWNWGVDIARSTARPFMQRGQIRDACYEKLVAAQVPWMFDRDSHRPAWQPTQLTALRGTLNDAIHLIRAALG